MNDQELAAKVKARYPQYKGMDDSVLAQKIKAKYPQYAKDQGTSVSPMAQKTAQAITMPGRGLRGIGVGAEQLMLHPSKPQAALAQAADAVQPGFQPKAGQKLGSFAAGQVDPVNLAFGAALPGGTLVRSILGGGAMSGGASALDQMAQGKISKRGTAVDALLGMLTGGAVHGIGRGASGLLNNAEPLFESTTGTPERATSIFKANPGIEKNYTGKPEEIEAKSGDVIKAVKDQYAAAKAYYSKATGSLGANLNAREKALAKPISALKIPDAIERLDQQVQMVQNPRYKDQVPDVFKALIHVRQSIDHHVGYSGGGVPEISSVQEGGLKELRQHVNQLIEKMPGGEVLRDADKTMAAASDIYGKLQPMMETPGKAIDFLKKTFEGKTATDKENIMNLLALEKATGKPVINDLFKAMTMSHFSQNLAGNVISRSIAGASPFLISAMMRVAGLPFQFSLPLSAVGVSATKSPKLQGMMVRGAQKYGPAIESTAKPLAISALNLLRKHRQENP